MNFKIELLKKRTLLKIKKYLYGIPLSKSHIPGSIIFLILIQNIIASFSYKKLSRSDKPSNFPITGEKDSFNSPIWRGTNGFDWYWRLHMDQRKFITANTVEDILALPIEILKCKVFKNSYKESFTRDSVLSFAAEFGEKVEFTQKINDKVKEEISKSSGKYEYIHVRSDSEISIKSKRPFLVGQGIPLYQEEKTSKDLVLLLFIDGLADRSILGINKLEDFMPNTAKYFSKGFDFRQHYASSEWTLPSVANFFTGQYTQNHKLFHPNKSTFLPSNIETLSEIFSLSNYMTFQAGGNWRVTPKYGYLRGFDRNIYQREMNAAQVIDHFVENQNTFQCRSTFSFLKFFDIHHDLGHINHLSNSIDLFDLTRSSNDLNVKSVYESKDPVKTAIYINKIRSLDARLGFLYSYLNNLEKTKRISVFLCTDHGRSFLSNDNCPLSLARTRIPFLFKSSDHSELREINEFTENIDIFKTILNDSKISIHSNKADSRLPLSLGGSNERKFSFSQSLYPGQTYKAIFRELNKSTYIESKQLVDQSGLIDITRMEEFTLKINNIISHDKIPKRYQTFLHSLFANI